MTASSLEILTIGHSTHSIERFLWLLDVNAVTAVVDVRSKPFSSHNPQFNQKSLAHELKSHKIAYVFVGEELGARSTDPSCYVGNQVQYSRLAKTEKFKAGIERVLHGAQKYRIALMCAEKEPLECHRTLLVGCALEARGVAISHILADGSVEANQQSMSRLLDLVGFPQTDMFKTRAELERGAREIWERKIAYTEVSNTEG